MTAVANFSDGATQVATRAREAGGPELPGAGGEFGCTAALFEDADNGMEIHDAVDTAPAPERPEAADEGRVGTPERQEAADDGRDGAARPEHTSADSQPGLMRAVAGDGGELGT